MNSFEAKKLNLPEIMARLGYQPTSTKKGGNEYWYNSPFRPEQDASFHTSYLGGKWIWNDFGDEGGTVIDFIMRHENYHAVSDALKFLDEIYQKGGSKLKSKPLFSFQQQAFSRSEGATNKELEFISASLIQNPLILNYLTKERGIEKNIALKYLEEVKYKNLNSGKEYFAFGIKNQSGGYEIRVASDKYKFKSSLIEKDITLILGSNSKIINVFEGMTDFLSLLTMMKTDRLSGDALLMHSLSSYKRTLEVIKAKTYKSVNLFLDNNQPGRDHTTAFIRDLGEGGVESYSNLFLPYIDINEALKANFTPKFS